MRIREINIPKEAVEIRFGTRNNTLTQTKREILDMEHRRFGEELDANNLIIDEPEYEDEIEADKDHVCELDDLDSLNSI